jgi:K+/H+ antiporter YhaU regulatory subunit KhtT
MSFKGVYAQLEADGKIHGSMKPYVFQEYPKRIYFKNDMGEKFSEVAKSRSEELHILDKKLQDGLVKEERFVDPNESERIELHKLASEAMERSRLLEKEIAELKAKYLTGASEKKTVKTSV